MDRPHGNAGRSQSATITKAIVSPKNKNGIQSACFCRFVAPPTQPQTKHFGGKVTIRHESWGAALLDCVHRQRRAASTMDGRSGTCFSAPIILSTNWQTALLRWWLRLELLLVGTGLSFVGDCNYSQVLSKHLSHAVVSQAIFATATKSVASQVGGGHVSDPMV